MAKRVALYARVSTRDGRQELDNQLRQLRQFAKAQGWTVTGEYCDQISGASQVKDTPELKRLFADSAARRFDRVLIWALDRLSRGTIVETFSRIQRLQSSGVDLWSLTEEHFRTSGPAGDLLIAVAAWIAEHERRRLQERIGAGLDRARAQGKTLGRPRSGVSHSDVLKLHEAGISAANIAAQTGLGRTAVYMRLREKHGKRV
jgi:DNA invertase Pin-like site-specific DNA recombinase